MNPKTNSQEFQSKIQEIKSIEEKIKNMGNTQEKINYLVEKRMSPLYKERFYVLTGKKKEINNEKKRSHWKDDELMDKIELVNNWKNINWFKPNKTYNPEMKKREILKPLVNNKEKILKEKDKLFFVISYTV